MANAIQHEHWSRYVPLLKSVEGETYSVHRSWEIGPPECTGVLIQKKGIVYELFEGRTRYKGTFVIAIGPNKAEFRAGLYELYRPKTNFEQS